jgi:hypothetical protein
VPVVIFAAGVREVNPGDRALRVDEADNPLQWFELLIAPNEILR